MRGRSVPAWIIHPIKKAGRGKYENLCSQNRRGDVFHLGIVAPQGGIQCLPTGHVTGSGNSSGKDLSRRLESFVFRFGRNNRGGCLQLAQQSRRLLDQPDHRERDRYRIHRICDGAGLPAGFPRNHGSSVLGVGSRIQYHRFEFTSKEYAGLIFIHI